MFELAASLTRCRQREQVPGEGSAVLEVPNGTAIMWPADGVEAVSM